MGIKARQATKFPPPLQRSVILLSNHSALHKAAYTCRRCRRQVKRKGEGKGSQLEESEPQTLPRSDEEGDGERRLKMKSVHERGRFVALHEIFGWLVSHLGTPCFWDVSLNLQDLQKQDHPPVHTHLSYIHQPCLGGGKRQRQGKSVSRERGSSMSLSGSDVRGSVFFGLII